MSDPLTVNNDPADGTDLKFVPGGREPVYLEDFLVECWRFHSVGRDDDARALLCGVWSWAMDGGSDAADIRVALRMLDRLGLTTDDPGAWAALPDQLTVYRAETGSRQDGFCWTLKRDVANMHASRHGLAITSGTVHKSHVLAYITLHGEDEIVVRRGNVRAFAERR